jgi:hypothetical protein
VKATIDSSGALSAPARLIPSKLLREVATRFNQRRAAFSFCPLGAPYKEQHVVPTKKAKHPKSPTPQDTLPIHPDWFYRVYDGWKYFGYRNSILHLKIESGEIPAPIALSDGGRARGWFGRTILAWQRERETKPVPKAIPACAARNKEQAARKRKAAGVTA